MLSSYLPLSLELQAGLTIENGLYWAKQPGVQSKEGWALNTAAGEGAKVLLGEVPRLQNTGRNSQERTVARGLMRDSMEPLALLRSIEGRRQIPTLSLSQGLALPRAVVNPTDLMETPAPIGSLVGLQAQVSTVVVELGGKESGH